MYNNKKYPAYKKKEIKFETRLKLSLRGPGVSVKIFDRLNNFLLRRVLQVGVYLVLLPRPQDAGLVIYLKSPEGLGIYYDNYRPPRVGGFINSRLKILEYEYVI